MTILDCKFTKQKRRKEKKYICQVLFKFHKRPVSKLLSLSQQKQFEDLLFVVVPFGVVFLHLHLAKLISISINWKLEFLFDDSCLMEQLTSFFPALGIWHKS